MFCHNYFTKIKKQKKICLHSRPLFKKKTVMTVTAIIFTGELCLRMKPYL